MDAVSERRPNNYRNSRPLGINVAFETDDRSLGRSPIQELIEMPPQGGIKVRPSYSNGCRAQRFQICPGLRVARQLFVFCS
jgi:hypothetical protein